MIKKLNEKVENEFCFLKCKECKNKLSEFINKTNIENLTIYDKNYYAIKLVDLRFYLLSGKTKLFNLSRNSFLYDEVLCIECSKKLGIEVKSCREEFKYFINNYFLIKAKKVIL